MTVSTGGASEKGQRTTVFTNTPAKPGVTSSTSAGLPGSTFNQNTNQIVATVNGPLPAQSSVSLTIGTNRLLVKDEGDAFRNGIYDFIQEGIAGGGGQPWILQRAESANTSAKVTAGIEVRVLEGDDKEQLFVLTTDNPIVLNTTDLAFEAEVITVPDPLFINTISAKVPANGVTITDELILNEGVELSDGKSLHTTQVAGNTALLQAYDTNLAVFVTFATLTANLTPTMDLSADVTIGGNPIASTLATALAGGNTTGVNDIIVDAGQKITVDTIEETSADNGVLVDSVLIKDGGISVDSTLSTSTLVDAGIGRTTGIFFSLFSPNDVTISPDNGVFGATSGGEVYLNKGASGEASFYIQGNQVISATGTGTASRAFVTNFNTDATKAAEFNQDSLLMAKSSSLTRKGLVIGFQGFTTQNADQLAAILNSRNSKINAGVVNSVVVGGKDITATLSETVYMPDIIAENATLGLAGELILNEDNGKIRWDADTFIERDGDAVIKYRSAQRHEFFYDQGTTTDHFVFQAGSLKQVSNTFINTLQMDGVSADRSWTLPDATGTISLIESAETFSGVKTFSVTPKTDAISERTADNGILIDAVRIKDKALSVELTNDEGVTAMVVGDVVIVGSSANSVLLSTSATDTMVAGVITKGGAAGAPVEMGVSGITTLKVDSAISIGDLLETSTTTGEARKAASPTKNAILAKALTSTVGAGTVTALIDLA